MSELWEAIGGTFQPVLISVATLAVLGLLRLITPAVRWHRRFKQDAEVYSALPDGKEKELWRESITAQAERLRIYREDARAGDRIYAWGSFAILAWFVGLLLHEMLNGWPGLPFIISEGPIMIPMALLAFINLGFAGVITARLVMGRSTAMRAGTGGHYPKYARFQRASKRRRAARANAERRLVIMQNRAEMEHTEAIREAKREARASAKRG